MANTASNAHRRDEGRQDKGQGATGVMETAKDAASNVADKAKQAAGAVASTVGNVASNVGDKVDSGVSAAGSGIQSLAGTIRDKGPQSGVLGSATSGVASALDASGRYLEEQGLSGIGEDLTNLIRRNPIPAMLIGVGLGFMLARMTRS
jgi:uncharacterized protein YjbJ (UPF0337 family)